MYTVRAYTLEFSDVQCFSEILGLVYKFIGLSYMYMYTEKTQTYLLSCHFLLQVAS